MAVENGIQVLIIKDDASGLRKGNKKTLSKDQAKRLVESGIAEYVEQQEKKTTKNKKK